MGSFFELLGPAYWFLPGPGWNVKQKDQGENYEAACG